MKKQVVNQQLLNEALKRFQLLSEYSFYTEEPKEEENLILGSDLDEEEEDPNNPNPAGVPAPAGGDDSKTANPDGAPAADPAAAPAPDPAAAAPAAPEAEEDNIFSTDGGDEAGMPDMGGDDMAMGGEEEVELEVTDLVKGTEEAKQSADNASHKTSSLLAKFSDLEKRIASMDALGNKIADLEKEIVKRNPTPIEKLEMRSLSSYPYSVKLTDYWADVEGYDATGASNKPEEYVLTQDEVDTGYTDASIKQTFDVPEDNEYEEEDI